MHRVTILLLATALAGCHTGQARVMSLERDGALRLDTVPGPGYDLTVEIRNLWDFSADGANPADRRAVALEAVAGRCASPTIVREDVITTGESLRGPLQTFLVRVRCPRA